MKKFFSYMLLFVMGTILGFVLGIFLINKEDDLIQVRTPNIDYNFNQSKIDSINKNIIEIDSIIYNIKYEDSIYKEKVFYISDSESVKLFYELIEGR